MFYSVVANQYQPNLYVIEVCRGGRGGILVSVSCMAVVVWPWTLASLTCRDGARRIFADLGRTMTVFALQQERREAKREMLVILVRSASALLYARLLGVIHIGRPFPSGITNSGIEIRTRYYSSSGPFCP